MNNTDRRTFLQSAGLAGIASAFSSAAAAQGTPAHEKAKTEAPASKHSIRFSVIGLDHAHIYGMTAALQRGGGKLVAVYGSDPKQVAEFRAKFGDVKVARTAEGGPYRRRNVVFVSEPLESDFAATLEALAEQGAREGVRVAEVIEDRSQPRLVFEPGHPDANAESYVAYPNVNPVGEMVDLMAATRAYEANVAAVNATKRVLEAALSIGEP